MTTRELLDAMAESAGLRTVDDLPEPKRSAIRDLWAAVDEAKGGATLRAPETAEERLFDCLIVGDDDLSDVYDDANPRPEDCGCGPCVEDAAETERAGRPFQAVDDSDFVRVDPFP